MLSNVKCDNRREESAIMWLGAFVGLVFIGAL